MGSAVASGPDRARLAVESSQEPSIRRRQFRGASGILLNVTVGTDLEISEFNQIETLFRVMQQKNQKSLLVLHYRVI